MAQKALIIFNASANRLRGVRVAQELYIIGEHLRGRRVHREESGTVRSSALGRAVSGISQKMLTQTLRAMERDGLVSRTIHRRCLRA